jgi:hypothetical protein
VKIMKEKVEGDTMNNRCPKCNAINTITLENGELKKQAIIVRWIRHPLVKGFYGILWNFNGKMLEHVLS